MTFQSEPRCKMTAQRGFTLIEVLVATVILSFGLLGLAAMQISSLRHNQSSYQRGQATQIGYELADLMRANRDAAIAGNYNIDGTSPTQAGLVDCNTTVCTAAQMAAFDVYVWWTGDFDLDGSSNAGHGVINRVPDGMAIVSCNDAPCTQASTHLVTVMWNDVRDFYEEDDEGNPLVDGGGLAQRDAVDVSGCTAGDRDCFCAPDKLECFDVEFQP